MIRLTLAVSPLVAVAFALVGCQGCPYPQDARAFQWNRESQSDEVLSVRFETTPAASNERASIRYQRSGDVLRCSLPIACVGDINRTITWSVDLKTDSFEHGASSESVIVTLPPPDGTADEDQFKDLPADCISARPKDPIGRMRQRLSFADYPVRVRWAVCSGTSGSWTEGIIGQEERVINSDAQAKSFAIELGADALSAARMADADEFTTLIEITPYAEGWKNQALLGSQKIYFQSAQPLPRRALLKGADGGDVASRR